MVRKDEDYPQSESKQKNLGIETNIKKKLLTGLKELRTLLTTAN